jgi:hypothetical protein
MQSRRLTGRYLAKASKFSILATRCGVNSNFLKPCKATVGIMGISSELLLDFRFFKKSVGFVKKGKFDGTSKKFGLRKSS